MRTPLTRIVLLLSLVALALGVPTAHAATAKAARSVPHIVVKDGLTQPVFSYKDAIRETVYVQSSEDQDDNGKLDLLSTDIIMPKEVKQGMKVPVIYEMSPYYQSEGRGNEDQVKNPEPSNFSPTFFPLFYDNYFVPRGYAVVLQDMRGTRDSEGCTVTGGADEVRDTVSTINWLTGHGKAFTGDGKPVTASWSSGHVGMIGKSYDGSVANGAASTGVKGLDTIVPISGISSWYDYAGTNGVQYENAVETPAEFELDPSLGRNIPDDDARQPGETENLASRFGICTKTSATVEVGSANPTFLQDSYWDQRNYRLNVGKVHAAVLLVHGLNDQNVKPDNYTYWWAGLAAHHVPRRILLHQNSHVDPFDIQRGMWVNMLHQWFDYWLQKIPNNAMKEPQATVEQTPGHWITEASWPAPGAHPVDYTFNPNGTLEANGSSDGSASFTDDPGLSEQSMADNPGTKSSNRLAYTTKPLAKDLHISGQIELTLKGAVNNADTHFTGLLVDYPPAGKTITTTAYESAGEGIENLKTKSCWGESTPDDSACYIDTKEQLETKPFEIITHGFMDAAHHVSLRTFSPLIPGTTYTFRFNLFGDDYIVDKGHRLGLIIAGSDSDNTIPAATVATTTLDLAGSHLTLPVVSAQAASAPKSVTPVHLSTPTKATATKATSTKASGALASTGGAPLLALAGLLVLATALGVRRFRS